MATSWNNYRFDSNPPVTRYYANYDDDDVTKYRNEPHVHRRRTLIYEKTGPPGWRPCNCGPLVGRYACCATIGAILLLCMIGGLVAALVIRGKDDSGSTTSMQATTTINANDLSTPSVSGASSAGSGATTPAGSGASQTGSGATTPAGSGASSAGSGATTPAGSGASTAGPAATTVSGLSATSAAQQVSSTGASVTTPATSVSQTTTAGASTTRPPILPCPTDPVLIYERVDSGDHFNKSLAEMKSGFGSPGGNYWRGLDDISTMSKTGEFKLAVYFETSGSGASYAVDYTTFTVGDESTGYQLNIAGFGGNFTFDAFGSYSGYKFTTYDKKNDDSPSGTNCAVNLGGAWWYGMQCSCGACFTQNSQFVWQLGFTPYFLSHARMQLVCKQA